VERGGLLALTFTCRNDSAYALNGAQAVVTLPEGVTFDSASSGSVTLQAQDVVVSLGRLLPGSAVTLEVRGRVSESAPGPKLEGFGILRSGTALPVAGNRTITRLNQAKQQE
jgi:hypothetical protein